MGHRRHQRTREAAEGLGESIHGLVVAAMRLAIDAERLDHRHPADELDGRAVQALEPGDEGLHLGAAGLHGAAQEQEEPRKWQQRRQRHAPVQREQVDDRQPDGARRAAHRRVEMRGQAVQRGDVILHRLLDLARRAAGEPAQRRLRQPPRHGQAQVMRDAVVGQMRGQLAGGHQRHAGEQASHAGARHPPEFGPPRRLGGIRRIEAGQQQLGDVRDTRQRRQRQHGAHRGQRRRGDQLPADRGQHLPERARCGRGDCGRAHEIGLPRCW
ncbi:Uncharacterised protein [Achromobacter sp. 2789STDY5608615]|nr:Uncharacterised protein [Achromobacter sp. 2789STDY5608615]